MGRWDREERQRLLRARQQQEALELAELDRQEAKAAADLEVALANSADPDAMRAEYEAASTVVRGPFWVGGGCLCEGRS